MINIVKERAVGGDGSTLQGDEMIRAALKGHKTQFRRVISPQPTGNDLRVCNESYDWGIGDDRYAWGLTAGDHGYEETRLRSPYGQPGDHLWVREPLYYEFTNADEDTPNGCLALYGTDGEVVHKGDRPAMYAWEPERLSPACMPRWASRIDLEITEVRIERIQEITASDCLAEGIDLPSAPGCHPENQIKPKGFDSWSAAKQEEWVNGTARAIHFARCDDAQNHVDTYRDFWNSINRRKPGCSWKSNPFVWVVSFKLA